MIRQRVRDVNRRGASVSLRSRRGWLHQACGHVALPVTTLWRPWQSMGLVHGASKRRSTVQARAEVIIASRESLRRKRGTRRPAGGPSRPEGSLEAPSLNVTHAKNHPGSCAPAGPWVHTPSGTGPRLLIGHAMTTEGWVPHAQVVCQAQTHPGDAHGQRHSEPFSTGLTEQLLPPMPLHALMLLDQAPSHTAWAQEAFPTPHTGKALLQQGLHTHPPTAYRDDRLTPDLSKPCRQLCPEPQRLRDRIAEAAGHPMGRTPPSHPELQPMATCWAITKA